MRTSAPAPPAIPNVFERLLPKPFRSWPLFCWFGIALLAGTPFVLAHFAATAAPMTEEGAIELALRFTGPAAALAFGLFLTPVAFSVCRNVMTAVADELPGFLEPAVPEAGDPRAWLLERLDFFRGRRATIAIAAGFAIGCPAVYGAAGFFEPVADAFPVVWLYLAMGVSSAAAGAGVVAVFDGAHLVWRLGQDFRVVHLQQAFGAQSIGSALFACYTVICIVWLTYMLSGAAYTDRLIGPMTFVGLPVGIFLFASFFLCQTPLHRRIRARKRERILSLQTALKQRLEAASAAASAAQIAEIAFLRGELDIVEAAPEWPFGRKVLVGNGVVSVFTIFAPAIVSMASTGDVVGALVKLIGVEGG